MYREWTGQRRRLLKQDKTSGCWVDAQYEEVKSVYQKLLVRKRNLRPGTGPISILKEEEALQGEIWHPVHEREDCKAPPTCQGLPQLPLVPGGMPDEVQCPCGPEDAQSPSTAGVAAATSGRLVHLSFPAEASPHAGVGRCSAGQEHAGAAAEPGRPDNKGGTSSARKEEEGDDFLLAFASIAEAELDDAFYLW
jgi:hypothetical protein